MMNMLIACLLQSLSQPVFQETKWFVNLVNEIWKFHTAQVYSSNLKNYFAQILVTFENVIWH